MEKRGLSTVVTTVIILLILIVAIGTVWGVIRSLLSDESLSAETKAQFLNERADIQAVSVSNLATASVTIKGISSGALDESFEIIEGSSPDVDLISVVDLSGSMVRCENIVPQAPNTLSTCCGLLNAPWSYTSPSNICEGATVPEMNLYCGSSAECDQGTHNNALTPSQDANKQLISNLFAQGDNKVGLIAYNGVTRITHSNSLVDSTQESVLITKIDSWTLAGGTCICCGINSARDELIANGDPLKNKVMIVMTDGGPGDTLVGCPSPEQGLVTGRLDAVQAATDAIAAVPNLIIHTVGVGTNADHTTLTDIANAGGGTYFGGAGYTVNDLLLQYQTIADQIIANYQTISSIDEYKIVFYDSTGSYSENVPALDSTEIKKLKFDLSASGLTGPIIKIEVYPIILDDNGKEIIGPMLDSWKA